MKSNTIKDFFKEAFKIDVEEMKVNQPIDVSFYNKKALSFNEKTKENELKEITKIIRKKDDYLYLTYVGCEVLENQKDHKFYVKFSKDKSPIYVKVRDLFKIKSPFYLLNKSGVWDKVDKIVKTEDKVKIFDFEVKDNHNYYSNNYLSHNTIFGDNRTTPGGNALKFYASQRVEVSKKGQGKDGEDILSQGCMCKIIKNKVGVPFRKALLSIKFGEGIDKLQEIIDLAIEEDIIHRGGSWFSYGDVFKVQGQPEVRSLMEDNEEMVEEIRDKILTNLGFND